ncbi:MAG: hypothetical protein HUU21_21120 [Polyangiaceae bacterium]|nr:hypothetical protein [Polyangiaceae bacterium]NUQ76049.1 hypothetical protein [Polyangiaceae bacterium]
MGAKFIGTAATKRGRARDGPRSGARRGESASAPGSALVATRRAVFAASSAWLLGRAFGALTAPIRARGS